MENPDHLRKLISIHNERLQLLKEIQARSGLDTDPKYLIEIRQKEAQIEELQAKLERVEGRAAPAAVPPTAAAKMSEPSQKLIKILFLAANPTDTTRLRIDAEIRAIDQALRQSEFRDKFDLKQHFAVSVFDIQGYLLRHKPDILHFSGHGHPSSEILLEDRSGESAPVPVRALRQLFAVFKDTITCVILNACYSEHQAQAIAEQIDCVIGMSKAIGDQAAISFAAAFYQALGFGQDLKTAFDLGCIQIDLENLEEHDTPQLIALNKNPKDIVFVF